MPIAAPRSATTARAVVQLTNLLLLSFLEEEKPIRRIGVLELSLVPENLLLNFC